jgi:hypothetical protein
VPKFFQANNAILHYFMVKVFRPSGGFFVEWWSRPTGRGRTLKSTPFQKWQYLKQIGYAEQRFGWYFNNIAKITNIIQGSVSYLMKHPLQCTNLISFFTNHNSRPLY